MEKYNRNYNLLVQRKDFQTVQIRPPFTIEFDIHRDTFSSANVASIRIYNLNDTNRNLIRKDQFDYWDNRIVEFAAGYGNNLSLAFKGNITQAWSVREGSDWISTLESFDGGFAHVAAITDRAYPAGTPQSAIIDSFANDLESYGITRGAIGEFPGEIQRGNTYTGSTVSLLNEVTGMAAFIDNCKINVLKDNECIQSNIPLINAKSGLLGTPIKEGEYIKFDMLFEPNLQIAQLINLQSSTTDLANVVNGIHKVVGLHHRGTISDAVCGSAITTVKLLSGSIGSQQNSFNPVQAGG